MRWVKLIVFIVLAGVLVGANLLFKDRLAERGLEAALESLFRARSEVDGLRLKLLGGKVAFRSLAVADEQEPMTNLFELGPTEADIDVVQLLSRKVVIESVACSDIRWGNPAGDLGGAARVRGRGRAGGRRVRQRPGAARPGADRLRPRCPSGGGKGESQEPCRLRAGQPLAQRGLRALAGPRRGPEPEGRAARRGHGGAPEDRFSKREEP